jgi:hypothetical protein
MGLAEVQRFAVIIGNNLGSGQDVELRYAESDAEKVARVLRDLGGYQPADIVLLRGEDATTVERSLQAVNERIVAAQNARATDTLLFVYYSGHADRQALRLGATRLPFTRLAEFVRGSPAKVRLLVVDACRSGALTRVKGGSVVLPFDLPGSQLLGEGVAFLTASAEDEDAQESDELQGSFFTHALVSGLMGAADRNSDGQVVLEEAYGHAYDSTLKATSGTFAGAQHPTFKYEVKGQGALVLTRISELSLQRASLVFPRGLSFFVLEKNARGRVVGEVNAADVARSLSVRPGDYFLRGRGEDHLLEGSVRVLKGQSLAVDPSRLTKVAYAKLVRKGGHERDYAHGPQFGVAVRSLLPNAETPCYGAALGYRLDLEPVSFTARLSGCTSSFENDDLTARTNELALSFAATHTWDWQTWSAYAGLGLGTTLVSQTFDTEGHAPARLSLSPLGILVGGASVAVSERSYLGLELNLEAHLLRVQQSVTGDEDLELGLAARGVFLGGVQF